MQQPDFGFIVQFYIFTLTCTFTYHLILINCLPLKVSKRKAVFLAFLYSQFIPLADTMTAYLVGGRIVEYNMFWYILLKIIILVEMYLPLSFIVKTIQRKWYKCYWIFIVSMLIGSPAAIPYTSNFLTTDVVKGVTYFPITTNNIWLYLFSIIVIVIYSIPVIFLFKKIAKIKRLEQVSNTAWTILNLGILLFILQGEKDYFVENNMMKGVSNVRLILSMFIGIVIIVVYIMGFTERRVLKVENQLLKKQNELQYQSYLNRQEFDMELRKMYHDIGNHIKTIQLLVNNGDEQKANAYAEELLETYQTLAKKNYCGNRIINAVLLEKMKLCEEHQIDTELDIMLPEELPIRDIDLMCVFSNLIDNAIESCCRLQDKLKYIRIKASIQNDYCTFYIVNGKLSKDEAGVVSGTWKKDKKLHGYGLKIIKEIVDRYQGQHEFTISDDQFQALVMMKL